MQLYSETNYKQAIKALVKESRARSAKGLTLKRIAAKIPLQYTYLSKALSDQKAHLSEDHLFSICQILQLVPEETEYLFLLRSQAIAQHSARRKYLEQRIERVRRAQKLRATVQEAEGALFTREMAYLSDPISIFVHVAVGIRKVAADPFKLIPLLGISPSQLQEILYRLRDLELIELSENGREVRKVLKNRIHYSTDHPMMRMHQSALREFTAGQIVRAPEEKKRRFMATFSADDETFRGIKDAFDGFLKEVEQRVIPSRHENLYHMEFDLFQAL